jgi:hypothetical protein
MSEVCRFEEFGEPQVMMTLEAIPLVPPVRRR